LRSLPQQVRSILDEFRQFLSQLMLGLPELLDQNADDPREFQHLWLEHLRLLSHQIVTVTPLCKEAIAGVY